MRASIFARLVERMGVHGPPQYPLHIGNTYMQPPRCARLETLVAAGMERPYDYAHPYGSLPLREALAEKLQRENGFAGAGPENVTFTTGATNALFAACQTVLSPGDEVLLPSPYWPLIHGIITASGATAIEIPFWPHLDTASPEEALALLRPHLSPRTAAIYVNTPSNPTGRCLPRATLQAIADLACEHDLWILADEAYEYYAFGDVPHCSIASLTGAEARTLTAYTFSKTFALAGYRAGYLAGPQDTMEAVRKLTNHSVYATSSVAQQACLTALSAGAAWLDDAQAAYSAGAALVAERLQARFRPAEGASYVWIEVEGDSWDVLDAALAQRVSLAPGPGFGDGFDRALRLCYVACDLTALAEAIDRLNTVFESTQ